MNKSLIIVCLLLTMFSTEARNKSICGFSDDRQRSTDLYIARLVSHKDGNSGCTGTLLANNCMITAGHCSSLTYAQFEPMRDDYFSTFRVKYLAYENKGRGQDWAVAKVSPNEDGLYPEEIQRGYYEVSLEKPRQGTQVSITGYGNDDDFMAFTQQIGYGVLEHEGNKVYPVLSHSIDTMGGNSGSSIFDVSTGKIIGVHSHGGCGYGMELNAGTSIYFNEEFKQEILKCLRK